MALQDRDRRAKIGGLDRPASRGGARERDCRRVPCRPSSTSRHSRPPGNPATARVSSSSAACPTSRDWDIGVTRTCRPPYSLADRDRPHGQWVHGVPALVRGADGGPGYGPSAVHEPSSVGPPYRASPMPPAEPSARRTPPRREPRSPTPGVRLHLRPGQRGTKQLLAQYGDRLICVRHRYDAQRRKRLKTVELLVAERDWTRHGRAAPATRSSGYGLPLPT
jgi:hypothetical protein